MGENIEDINREVEAEDVENSEEWEELISTGMEARSEKDKAQWMLGDLAFKVYSKYGKHQVENYATRIGVQKTTLLRYMDVSRAIEPDLREEFKKLSWSHFKEASGTDNPKEWLEKADTGEWSVEMMALEKKKAKGEHVEPELEFKVTECPFCHRATLVGNPDKICDNFKDCRDTAR